VNELKKWLGDERIKAFTGDLVGTDKSQMVKEFTIGVRIHPVCIMSYERVRALGDALKKADFDLIVCDEGHRLKSGAIKTSQVLRSMKCRRRVILSGTPIQNDLSEFFAMVDFVNPGILGAQATFKKVFEDPIMRSRQPNAGSEDQLLGQERSEELTRLTGLFVLRRTAEVNQKYLKPKNDIVVFCRPSELQKKLYRRLLDNPILSNLSSAYSIKSVDQSQHLVAIGALRKLANSPRLLYDSAKSSCDEGIYEGVQECVEGSDIDAVEHSGKLTTLMCMLQQFRQDHPKDKVVIVSNFTKTLDIIEALAQSHDYSFFRLDGSTQASKRMDYVDRFNRPDNTTFLFLLSTKSGGAGLNLVGANRLILFDVDWNPSNDLQAMARIWRDGQRADQVYIYRLIVTGTIEEKIYQRQAVKISLSDSLIDDKSTEVNKFSLEDLRDLFTLDEETDCQTHDLLCCDCLDRVAEETAQLKETAMDILMDPDEMLLDLEQVMTMPASNPQKRVSGGVKKKETSLTTSLRTSELASEWIHVATNPVSEKMQHTVAQFDSVIAKMITTSNMSFLMLKRTETRT
jgi:DNA repair and recombination protein RAD54B